MKLAVVFSPRVQKERLWLDLDYPKKYRPEFPFLLTLSPWQAPLGQRDLPTESSRWLKTCNCLESLSSTTPTSRTLLSP